ncbi:Muniscin C-terminal mu homology domain-containing protein [Mucor lusitanicus]|uniref:Muniscin C-terminal mu homology domain-containing protein n=1 Tax=Mucor circinelloides f. lusitanicus TaxID=29924 RepID=A0A8H4F5F5_MUCCL|nr:Muniscin C-terminal mu homology domain-containing protein [Mucor lusitanicus]
MSSPNAYVDAFLTKKPKEGITIAQTRLKDAMALDMELAEYFKERSQIEEAYAKSLAKASKRLYTMDPGVLGHFAPVWELLLKEFNQVANYHSEMAHQVSQTIEKPLRASPSEDYHRLQQLEPLMQSLESKNKLSSVKGSIFKKSRNSTSSAKSGSWQHQGVEYLNLHQKLDQARLTRLKTLVQDFEKIQSEQLMKRVEMASTTLSAAEAFDVEHDIDDFCRERGRGLQTLDHDGQSTANSSRQRSSTISSHDSHRSTNKFKSVFMKKKKTGDVQEEEDEIPSPQTSFAADSTPAVVPEHRYAPAPVESTSTPTMNSAPLIDAEGFSIPQSTNSFPTIASDISSRNTSDEDFQSLKLNQKLQINIKNDAVQEESTEANESFNKMANMLREILNDFSCSTVNRSQTESTLFSTTPNYGLENPRANSMISTSSNDTSHSNPFKAAPSPTVPHAAYGAPTQSQSPSMANTGVTLSDAPVSWLQPIPEVNSQQQYLSVSILEKTTLTSPDTLLISGQIMVFHHGPASATPIPLQLHHTDGMQQFLPNPQYITQQADGVYMLNTSQIQSDSPVPCFAYEISSSVLALPVRLLPSWKCVDGISYLMIKHNKNAVLDPSKLSGHVYVNMPDQQVTNVQSTPQGTWDVTKHRLTWKMSDILEQYGDGASQQQQRLLAKFYLDGHGSPQPVHLNYQWHDTLASGLSVTCGSLEIKHMETAVQSHQIVYM